MEIDDKVVSELYTEYGSGIIISKNKMFDKEFYGVFFESAGKVIEIQLDDLKPIDSPTNLFKSNILSSPIEFRLNSMAHAIEVMASSEKPSSPANFKINSLPHQLLALDFVISQFRPRCLLADEVGLGKTIEAALIMEELKLRNIVKRVLIITPAGLINQWKDELKLKFSEDFSIFDGETFKSFKQLYGQETNCWLKFDQVITSIDFLKPKKMHNDLLEYELERRQEHNKYVFKDCVNANWDMVIIDEAHKLSKYKTGEETARFKLGNSLSDGVPVFLILTATPHRGEPYVFKNLLALVDPYRFSKLEDVKPENINKMTVRNKKRACIDFNGNRLFKNRITTLCKIKWDKGVDEPEAKLYDAIVEYITEYYDYARKEKNNTLIFLLMLYQRIVSSSSRAILKSLGKRFKTLKSLAYKAKRISESSLDDFFEFPGEKQLEFMEKIVPILSNPELIGKEIKTVSSCIELAKKALIGRNDAKLRKLIEIIDEIKRKANDKNIKILIFTEFIETQRYIIESLEKIGYEMAFINGKLSLSDRILQKQCFRDKAQILVSTDAGGEGINLQFCHVVINYDLPWNPMKIEQRIGRVDRIGQDEDVIAINFILEDTIEEYVRERIEYKLQLIKEQFGEDKLHDILSTLNEEFNFDRLYVEYIAKNKYNDYALENISDNIYQKAKEILENDEILIPFTDVEKVKDFEIEDIRNTSKKNQIFSELFLKNRGLEFNEYKDNPSLFHFRNDFRTDILQNHYSKVIFDQSLGLDIEDSELFCIKHPFIKEAIVSSKNKGRTSHFYIDENKFHDTAGVLFNWLFTISNNFNMHRQYLIPTFISNTLKYNRRLSEYLKNMDNLSLEECKEKVDCNIDDYYHQALAVAEKMTENIFWEMEQNWRMKIDMDKEKLEKYYKQKAKAIGQIKIDNIREGKQNELRKEKEHKLTESKKQSHLFPELDCIQIAKIIFR